jgi:serine/threonine protein kinase/tetratricopeptide (TPR) repeat protein
MRTRASSAEAYLQAFPALAASAEDALVLIWGEVLLRFQAGEAPTLEEYRARFSEHADALAAQFELQRHLGQPASAARGRTRSERDIFDAALAMDNPAERAAYLEQACAANPQLRARIDDLLRAPNQLGRFLQAQDPDAVATVEQPISEGPGTIIGPYKLLQQIGEGGFGVVFLAEQHQPVRRKVAVKVVKPGMDTKQVIARFEAERQALALMDHPNIAKVLDSGQTAAGRPYFVMDLVKGLPITDYCNQAKLTLRERLELFGDVCQAIKHAHQKGIIHRDLKPSNVLVTEQDGAALVKVIDFGIAKALGQQLTDKTLFTGFQAMIGTPLYMSPEQAALSNVDVDTRSDVYSLGVLLYELLTGTTPFDCERLRQAGYEEIRRIIREEEPPKPSTRVRTLGKAATTLSTQRKSDPKRLSQLFRAELDWIVMKCLEKDRNRRYETANGLAMDLRRYLADEPVQACPPSTLYRMRKFARKYRTPLRVAGVLVMFLVLATVVSTWQAVLATRAERQAVAERDRTEKSFRMARDAVDRLFTQVSQSPKLKAHGLEKFRKELLQNAKEFYERFIREQFDAPGVRYDLGLALYRLGEIHRELGDYAAAEESLTKAVELLGELVRVQPDVAEYQRDLSASYAALGLVHTDTGHGEKAQAAFEEALAIQEKQVEAHPQAAEYRYALAKTYRASGEMHTRTAPETGAARYQQALAILNKLVRDFPVAEYQALLATTQMNLGNFYAIKGWFDKAEAASKEAQRLYGRLAQGKADALPDHWEALGRSHAILGMAYRGQGQTEKAEAAGQQAMEIFDKLAKEHSDVLLYTYDRGRCYTELGLTAKRAGRPDAAVARYDKGIAILEDLQSRGYGGAKIVILLARIHRTTALASRGDHVQATAEAEAVIQQGELTSGHLYDLACTFSQASAAAERDNKLPSAERIRLKARHADRAMDFLRQAVEAGWNSPEHLKTDLDVDPLRARDDFRKLSAELEAKAKK